MVNKFLYGEMTWPEIRDVAKENRVALLPVAMIEDHGYHLPVDTDVKLCWEVCKRTGELVPQDVVVVPPIMHGYSPHHMDFPGSLTVHPDTFINYVLDVCKSLVHHGFRRILIANGHGSNAHLLDSVARRVVIETDGQVICCARFYLSSAKYAEVASQILEEPPNAGGHADEFETSIYLALQPELVDMSKAVKELRSPSLSVETGAAGAMPDVWPYWSTHTESGILGDATLATKEKGEKLLEAAAAGLADIVRELRKRDIPKRVDRHV